MNFLKFARFILEPGEKLSEVINRLSIALLDEVAPPQ